MKRSKHGSLLKQVLTACVTMTVLCVSVFLWNVTAEASEPGKEPRPEIVSIELVSPTEGKLLHNTELRWKVVYKGLTAAEPVILFTCKGDRGYTDAFLNSGAKSEDNGDGTRTVYIVGDESRAPGNYWIQSAQIRDESGANSYDGGTADNFSLKSDDEDYAPLNVPGTSFTIALSEADIATAKAVRIDTAKGDKDNLNQGAALDVVVEMENQTGHPVTISPKECEITFYCQETADKGEFEAANETYRGTAAPFTIDAGAAGEVRIPISVSESAPGGKRELQTIDIAMGEEYILRYDTFMTDTFWGMYGNDCVTGFRYNDEGSFTVISKTAADYDAPYIQSLEVAPAAAGLSDTLEFTAQVDYGLAEPSRLCLVFAHLDNPDSIVVFDMQEGLSCENQVLKCTAALKEQESFMEGKYRLQTVDIDDVNYRSRRYSYDESTGKMTEEVIELEGAEPGSFEGCALELTESKEPEDGSEGPYIAGVEIEGDSKVTLPDQDTLRFRVYVDDYNPEFGSDFDVSLDFVHGKYTENTISYTIENLTWAVEGICLEFDVNIYSDNPDNQDMILNGVYRLHTIGVGYAGSGETRLYSYDGAGLAGKDPTGENVTFDTVQFTVEGSELDDSDVHEHEYKNTVTKATAAKNGVIVGRCDCGDVKRTVIYYPKKITLSSVSAVYNGKAKKPGVTVKDSRGKTVSARNYTVSYPKGCKNVGRYTIKIDFKGNYKGSVKRTFDILPKETSITKAAPGKKSMTVKWKKQSAQTTGYQIQYSADSKFKSGNKIVKINKNKTVSKKIPKLKAKKKYYVRIRTYKTVKVNGKSVNLYSGWSKAKTIRTKR